MATSTLANFPNSHYLLEETVRPIVAPDYPKQQPDFRVFPTTTAVYNRGIVALASNQTISRHKSLTLSLRKCKSLDNPRREGATNAKN